MNFLKKKPLLALVTITLVAVAQSAIASSSAQATINWDSLNVKIIDLSNGLNAPVFNWLSESGNVRSNSDTRIPYDSQSDSNYIPDFSSTLSTNTVTASAQSSTLRNTAVLQAYAASQPSTLINYYENTASASAQNFGNFSLTGYGIALITLDWNVSVTGVINDSSDYSYAQAFINGSLFDGNYGSGSASSTSSGNSSADNGSYSENGTFSFAIFGNGSNNITGDINAVAYVSSVSSLSQVPLPSAVWLFLSAFIGVLGLTQRKVASIA
ncbi:hypothetical protein [Methylobacter psychrophilus]|uniref:hypothetical protein n=1 Tax=Methylobacter psychrophilus TaxID=96941 RepID=UPI0021D50998|nr:hypothetical protein [Methylobacter psychrophilus]